MLLLPLRTLFLRAHTLSDPASRNPTTSSRAHARAREAVGRCHTSTHERSALRGEAPQRQSLPLGRDRWAVLRLPRGSRRSPGQRRRRQRRPHEATNPRQREPVLAETEPLQPNASTSKSPSAVRPALALTGDEELETIRSVLLDAATSTTRETWATCTCPECGKGFRQEISVPDHGARIKAIETLLREGLGRVGEAELVEPKVPQSVEELRNLSSAESN